MLSHRASRPAHRASPEPATTPPRLEVCPPRPFGDEEPLVKRLWRSVSGHAALQDDPVLQRLRAAREEFSAVLDDIADRDAHFLQQRLLHCRSLRELWHLRSEIFYLVARHHSQQEAQARLAPLNRYFPTRAPGSGFAPPDF